MEEDSPAGVSTHGLIRGFLDPTLECASPISADASLAGAVNLNARAV
jgi:hypothetical protein